MNRKPSFTNAILDFLEGKGFYLVVLLCVTVVGFSGWYLATQLGGPGDEPIDAVTATAPVTDGDAETAGSVPETGESAPVSGKAGIRVPAGSKPSPDPSASPSTEVTDPNPALTPAVSPETGAETGAETEEERVTTQVPLVYTWPVKGDVITAHSGDELVYNETMGDWRVHEGLDIAAVPGTEVLAAAAGTVAAIDAHDLMGTTVVIDHGEGMVSCYANLQSVPAVNVGDRVYTGTVIGAVGATAIAESAMAGHLHFSLTKEGAAVDPMDYLPQP